MPQVRSSESRDGCGERATATPAFRRSAVVMSRNHTQANLPNTTLLAPNTLVNSYTVPSKLAYISQSTHNTMASRALSMPARRLATAASISTPALSRRSFQSSARMLEVPAGVMPVRKPVGAFRGGYVASLYSPYSLLPCGFPTFRLLSLPPLSIFDFALSHDAYTD
jgi:hypothetical protein